MMKSWSSREFAQLVVLHDTCPNWWTYIMQHYELRKFYAPFNMYSVRPRLQEKGLLFDCMQSRWRVSAKWAVCNIVRRLHGQVNRDLLSSWEDAMRLLKQKMGNKIKGTHGQVMLFTQLNSPNIAHFCAFGKICSNDPERNFRCYCPCLASLAMDWFCTFL